MAMMGSAPTGGGSEMSFVDVIGMLKDEPSYQTKLREIGNRLNETKAAEKHIVEATAKNEEIKKFTADMAAKAEKQLIEARQLKDEADRQVATAVQHERDLTAQHAAFQQQAEAELEGHRQHLRDAFTTREKEVAAKEKALLDKMKFLEGQKEDHAARVTEFATLQKAKEAELAKKNAVLQEELDKVAQAKADSTEIRRQLQEKLKKIKEISAA